MKSDYNGLVEQSEMNQSIDENFNTEELRASATCTVTRHSQDYLNRPMRTLSTSASPPPSPHTSSPSLSSTWIFGAARE
jgi:hypothetical protein